MARIAVITHQYDCFESFRFFVWLRRRFLMQDVLGEMRKRGHKIRVLAGADKFVEADGAVLHIDCSIVPPAYRDLARRYPVAVNAEATDITKRNVSGALYDPEADAGWTGPVIVKSNYNAGARGENFHNKEARRKGQPPPHPKVSGTVSYSIYERADDVPEAIWRDEGLVVEKLIPEPDPNGYAMRVWVFLGERERCTRYIGPSPIVKGADIISREPVPVPDELREQRRRLGFDFGKFDFVMHQGRAVLVDANRTPGSIRGMSPELAKGTLNLVEGLEAFIANPKATR